ncbi:hypothetical protein PTTG_03669 [Puccinia triticina 1-1 BBBD Race 1]|uniref:GDT1 family protein n=2 Tax=Puccinia triticina TaxID=208348 RepID=A0A0C4ES95_PUCT1|nr:uncharacterized protein PtA15_12A578 [Puccinia triticina]OAV93571.1 hypothetical protein PTTG_03669 [Puccinia triticina 1-1 BBBD Race 1]WAQ90588.1 hypothetical protein PtA15_12A578 [Puccinia triticina]WAR61900.1 hypothetical protein PtB15_12B592 [Puccinia triticina]
MSTTTTVLPPPPVLFPSLAGLDRAIVMIIVSEIGDKTFLLAALLAMQHPRLIVFTGAFLALLVMSVLSAGLGHVLPSLISRRYTVLAASALFLVFGLKMLREGIEMEGGTGKVESEIEEVEQEIREKGEDLEPEHARLEEARPTARSRQLTGNRGSFKRSRSQDHQKLDGLKNLVYLLISPVLIQTFIMTFLAEWGDRSQISTIALAAAHNVYIVSLGTALGHALCTFFAVMGGRWLATKISVKYVTLGGAILFLIFGVLYLYEGLTWQEIVVEGLEPSGELRERASKIAMGIAPVGKVEG